MFPATRPTRVIKPAEGTAREQTTKRRLDSAAVLFDEVQVLIELDHRDLCLNQVENNLNLPSGLSRDFLSWRRHEADEMRALVLEKLFNLFKVCVILSEEGK